MFFNYCRAVSCVSRCFCGLWWLPPSSGAKSQAINETIFLLEWGSGGVQDRSLKPRVFVFLSVVSNICRCFSMDAFSYVSQSFWVPAGSKIETPSLKAERVSILTSLFSFAFCGSRRLSPSSGSKSQSKNRTIFLLEWSPGKVQDRNSKPRSREFLFLCLWFPLFSCVFQWFLYGFQCFSMFLGPGRVQERNSEPRRREFLS